MIVTIQVQASGMGPLCAFVVGRQSNLSKIWTGWIIVFLRTLVGAVVTWVPRLLSRAGVTIVRA